MPLPKRKTASPLPGGQQATPPDDWPRTLHLISHDLLQHKLGRMRNVECRSVEFRRLMREVGLIMGCEVTRHLPLLRLEEPIQTPIAGGFHPRFIPNDNAVIVPILRAGLIFAESLADIMTESLMGHMGLVRDEESLEPIEYMVRLPERKDRFFFLADPVIATGHTADYAVRLLKEYGVPPDNIIFMSLLVARDGIMNLYQWHPDVNFFFAEIDETVNKDGYLEPGIGDVGDRLFGTME